MPRIDLESPTGIRVGDRLLLISSSDGDDQYTDPIDVVEPGDEQTMIDFTAEGAPGPFRLPNDQPVTVTREDDPT